MNAAELLVKCLENEKVKYVFGIPGEENEDFLFALEASSIQFIPTRHEQGAAFMANVWGRLTGKAGVCLSTLGPGATNLVTGVADANLDKAPLVAITGQGDQDRLHHESHQIIDVVRMMRPITKWSQTIRSTDQIAEITRKAFKLAQAEKPGATHIELPEDLANEEVLDETVLQSIQVKRPLPNLSAVELASQIILKSSYPIIIAGNGAIRNRASQALTHFSQKNNIPVVTTFMGKGAVSEKLNHSIGTIGLGFKDFIIEAMEMADVVITVGYDIAEYNPQKWNPNRNKQIIHLDFQPSEVYTHYIPEVEIVADLAESVSALDQMMEVQPFPSWFTEIKNRIQSSIASYQITNQQSFHVPGVLHEIRNILPDDGLVISDVGSHKMWIARNFQTYCPNGCIISNGLASMGISLPGGIAAKLENPQRPVISMMGDGGALMNIQELETLKRLDLGLIIIIFNDNDFGLIRWKQEMSQSKSFGTRIGNPNFVKLAESFGIEATKPSDVSDLRKILEDAIANNKRMLIEIPITTNVNDELIQNLDNYFQTAKS